MECTTMLRYLNLNALVFVSWVGFSLNVRPRVFAKNSTKAAIKHFAHLIKTTCLEIWTTAQYGHLWKKRDWWNMFNDGDTSKDLCNEKNVTAEPFLEITINEPSPIQQQKVRNKWRLQSGGITVMSVSSAAKAKSASAILSQGSQYLRVVHSWKKNEQSSGAYLVKVDLQQVLLFFPLKNMQG